MKSRYLPLFFGAALAPFSPATVNAAIEDIRINEVLIDPGLDLESDGAGNDDDDNFEYIELISTHGGVESTTGLTILLIDTTGGNIGSIREAWSLDGMATGSNGLLLLGNGYDEGDVPHSNVPVATGLGDPAGDGLAQPRLSGLGNDDIEPNDGLTLLLVTGYSPTARIDEDLDTNDSGVFNFTRWTSIVDSVGIGDRAEPNDSYAGADLTQNGYDPDLVARKPGELAPNSAAAWFGGNILGDDPLGVALDPVRQFGSFPDGAATPGRPNAPFMLSDLRINEVNINPPGSGAGRFQYIEIVNADGGVASANGYHLLVVNTDDGSDPTCVADHRTLGTIVEAWDLAPFSTGANGLMLIGDGYDLETPWDSAVESDTTEADPDGFGSGDIGNRIAVKESTVCGSDRTDEGFTLLLVTGFSGAVDNDVDSDDDGVLNGTLPWDEIVDSVGYGKLNIAQTANVTATYAGADVSQVSAEGGYEPDNVSRRSDNMTANSTAAWYGGDFGGKSASSTNFKPDSSFGGFAGRATPGAANLAAAPEPGSLVINEVNIDPPGPEGSDLNSVEFIEIANPDGVMTGGQGYHLLVVVPGGEVTEIWDLSPFNTGANGLAVFGDVDDSWAYDTPTVKGTADPATTREDPDGYDNGDLPNGDFSLLLVTGFAGSLGVDLDSDDDGEFDDPLGFTVVDGFGFGASVDSGIADLSQPGYMPDSVSRVAGMFTPRTAAAWAGGELAGSEGTSVDYTSNFFGPFRSGASPGRLNHAATPGGGTIVINEVNVNPPGDDDNFEFVELVTSSLGGQSTNGLTLLVIDAYGGGDGLGNTGEILEVWSLDSLKTGTNGLLLLGNDYPTMNPFALVSPPAPGTEIADPEGLGNANLEPNDGLLLMLVRGFIGNRFEDLDEAPQGSFDSLPWDEIVDSIGFGTRVYGQPDAMMGLGAATWTADHVSRVGRIGNLTPLEIGDWFVGSLAGATGTATAYHLTERFDHSGLLQPAEFMATPGSHNPGGNIGDDLVDNDSDGLVNMIEDAIGSDRDVSDTEKHPTGLIVDVGGTDYQAITYTRLTGGSGTTGVDWVAGGFRYTVEVSADLESWVSGAEYVEALGAVVDNGDGTETVVVRLEQAVTSPPGANRFLRLKVTRL